MISIPELDIGTTEDVAYVMLNLCLYQQHDVVQAALHLLMAQYNTRETLLMGMRQLQLLTTDKVSCGIQ